MTHDWHRLEVGEIAFDEYMTGVVERAPTVLGRDIDQALAAAVRWHTLVVHGPNDHVIPHRVGEELATRTGGRLVSLQGSGHIPLAREPVLVNLLIRDFVRSLGEVRP